MKYPILDDLRSKHPKQNVVCLALRKLTSPEQISQFFGDYIASLGEHENPAISKDAKSVAASNVGYLLRGCDEETIARWTGAVPELGRADIAYHSPLFEKCFEGEADGVHVTAFIPTGALSAGV